MPPLKRENFDETYWLDEKDFDNFSKNNFDISFDAANILKIGKDLLFNISSYNHKL